MDEEVLKALNLIYEKLCALEERVEANEKVLMDDLIGGVTELYSSGQKDMRIKGLSEKYGEKFKPFGGALKILMGDRDPIEALDGELEGLRGNEGFDEEGHVNEVLGKIASLADSLKDYHAQTEAKEKETAAPESPSVEIEKEVTIEKPKSESRGKKPPSFWEDR